VRDQLIHHGFMNRYTRWVRHIENIKIIDNIKNIIQDESEGDDLNLDNDERNVSENENVENIENTDNVESHKLDEIMNDIEADFIDIPKNIKYLGNDSNIPLFSDYMLCDPFSRAPHRHWWR
jgi:hypothetical protein